MVTQRSGEGQRGAWRRAVVCGVAGVALVAVSTSRWGPSAGADPAAAGPSTASVAVAATDIPAGSIVDSSMLTTSQLPASATAGLVRDATTLVGRVVVVPLVRGEPIGAGVTAPRPAATAGHRLIRVSVASVDVAPDVRVGAGADLVASFPPTASEPRPTATVVATARVVSLERQPESAPQSITDSPGLGASAGLIGATIAVTLDCAAADALRVLTARDNARTLRLLTHPGGDANPPPP